ncbi:protein disulfide-isomerase domain [Emergomyces africanus]|uniref:Protein disulfide-isomerase n=1 Tax=Emergomyces africanus TaxID=1955775 RepID=A0A1B7NY39_9EURO|nr:protein disulfide-isomerase domain [Emergomyces africanus]
MRQFRDFAFGLAALGLTALASASAPEADAAADAPSDANSDVHVLKADTFDDFIKSNDLVLAEFYAPWCGHCKALAPEYEAAATQLKEKNIPLAKIDCSEEGNLCQEHGVEGYPTLKVFRGLDSVKPYNGPRKSGAIASFMVKQSLPAVTTVTTENIEDVKTMDKIVIIGYWAEDDKASNTTFTAVAEALRDDFLFAGTNDAKLAAAEDVKQPAIVLFKDFDERKAVFKEKFDQEAISKFVKVESTPLVGEVGPETYAGYVASGLPLAYIFAETPEEREKFAAMLKPIAEKHKGLVNLATIDAKAFGAHAGNLNLDPERFPAFAIHDGAKNNKFPFDQSKEITHNNIAEFVQAVLDGKIEPSIKSEPIPEKQDGPVTVVVAHTYKELVIDNDKDVLLEFYAPWCGHCKSLAPKYEQLGKLYAENPDFASKVTIAKIDATANDVPEDIQGFPTVKLYPAGAKDSPIDYTGARTVEALANFVRDNGKHGVDAYDESKVSQDGGDITNKPAAASPSSTAAADEPSRHEEL